MRKVCLFLLVFIIFGSHLLFADEVDDLIRQLDDPDMSKVKTAISKLHFQHGQDPRVVDSFIRLLKTHPDEFVRQSAAQMLGFRDSLDPEAGELLIQILTNDSSQFVRPHAAEALRKYKNVRSLKPLAQALGNKEDLTRLWGLQSILELAKENIKDPDIVDQVLQALSDSDPECRGFAASVLGHYKESRTVDPLIRLLKDQAPVVRAYTAGALGMIGDKRAIKELSRLTNDSDENVRGWVAQALKDLGASAEDAEKAGELRSALDRYVAEVPAKPYDFELRKKIIQIANQLNPKPAVPEDARQAMARGQVEFRDAKSTEDLHKAAQEFQSASNRAPWWPDAYYNLGLVREKLRQFEDALFNLNLYLEASPTAGDIESVKQKIYEVEYAKKKFDDANRLMVDGALLVQKNQYEEAIPLLEKAIQTDPNHGEAHAYLGDAHYHLKQHKEAVPELEQAIQLGEKKLKNYVMLGWCYSVVQEDIDLAIETYEQGLKEATDLFDIYWKSEADYYLGIWYEKKQNVEEAIRHYEEAVKSAHSEKEDIQRRLDSLR